MLSRHVVVRYHEIALKRNNRRRFVDQLARNIRRMLEGTGVLGISRGPGRLIVRIAEEASWPEIRERLRRVCGVANFLISHRAERTIEAITELVLMEVDERHFDSFAIRTKRADKTFALESPEVNRLVGQAVKDRSGSRVDLSHPGLEIHVEITERSAFVSLEKTAGPGGLPLASSGRVVVLLSGGIDSPVAARRMMQRGCLAEFVHFHAVPLQTQASQQKALEILDVLSHWQPDCRLHLVPFGSIQQEIVRQVRRPHRIVLYRRMMLRIAEAIAARTHAEALVTGESLGQVASQTLSNIAAIEEAATLPVLRPLIGMDKAEIITQAEALGTFETSILPDEDCCQLFVPRHPATRMTAAQACEAEQPLDIPAFIESALAQTEVVEVRFPRRARA
jgi:tRNA uracil 4-sulfurtransferase